MDKLAVIMNNMNQIASFEEAANLTVFENLDGVWCTKRTIFADIRFVEGLPVLRGELARLAAELGDCKIIAGKKISGVPYQIFDKLGFEIFEIERLSEAVLDRILSDVAAAKEQADANSPAAPAEIGEPGVYFLDLIALQAKNPELSSKMALMPFLNGTPFLRLDLICRHLPPWLEKLAGEKGLELETKKLAEEKIRVSVRKKSCE